MIYTDKYGCMCYICIVCIYTCVCSLGKWLIPELEQGKYKMCLEHPVEESSKYSKIWCQEDTGASMKFLLAKS